MTTFYSTFHKEFRKAISGGQQFKDKRPSHFFVLIYAKKYKWNNWKKTAYDFSADFSLILPTLGFSSTPTIFLIYNFSTQKTIFRIFLQILCLAENLRVG